MTGPLLPPRDLTADEARGFRIACACIASWGQQLASDPTVTGSPGQDQARGMLRRSGQVATAMARALDRTLGQPPLAP